MEHHRAPSLGLAAVIAFTGAAAAEPSPPSIWHTVVAGDLSEMERLALSDLRRFLAQATGRDPQVLRPEGWRAAPRPALIAGTPEGNELLAGLPIDRGSLGDDGYRLSSETIGGTRAAVAVGATPRGAVNAVYGLLREIGFGFWLGSESIPDSLPPSLPESPVVRRPAFTVRGVLPWYNFFNSPTAWDPIDHRAFADALVRMGASFVGFHSYDGEPFAAYEEGGRMRWGGRLLSTRSPTWGTHPLATADFPFGSGRLFDQDHFGASTTAIAGDDQAIRAEREVLRQALDHARRRGLRTCLGFEVNGDPTTAADREVFLRRIEAVLDGYPSLDFIWIWEPETQGVQGYAPAYRQHILRDRLETGSALEAYGALRREDFRRVVERTAGERPFFRDGEEGKAARAIEGARLEQFARLALRALDRRRDAPRLVISGWGGDERLLSAEYDAGLDLLLPPEVVFSSLDHIVPRERVDAVYGELPPGRERWPIPWLELDGDQWHPQPWVHVYEKLAADIARGGSRGVLGIHWRTRDVEENLAFLVEAAWEPGLTAGRFFERLARRRYPAEIAGEMARVHSDLDLLGYRWVGGAGQAECAPFDWGPGTEEKARALASIRERAERLLPRAGRGTPHLAWLLRTIDWVLLFREAEAAAVRARELLRGGKPAEALALLDRGDLGRAAAAYARRLTTRGEHGVFATIHAKAGVAWRSLREDCAKALGIATPPEPEVPWEGPREIVLPRSLGSAAEGRDLALEPIVLGGGPAWARWRTLGRREWTAAPLAEVRGWVRRITIPAAHMIAPGIELVLSLEGGTEAPPALGPLGLTVMPAAGPPPAPPEKIPLPPGEGAIRLTARSGRAFPFEISWEEVPGAEWYRIHRDGVPVADTAVNTFPDAPAAPAARRKYSVEAWGGGRVLARAEASLPSPDEPPGGPPSLRWIPRDDGITLVLPPAASLQVAAWRVRAIPAGGGAPAASVDVPPRRSGAQRRAVPLERGRWTVEVAAVNQAGREGPAAAISVERPVAIETRAIDLPLTAAPPGARVEGAVSFGPAGASFAGGWIEVPDDPAFLLDGPTAVELEFQAEDTRGMPVILSHGLWQVDGWFLQVLDGRLVVRTPRGDAWGPAVVPGRRHSVRWEFDGLDHRLLVDGAEVQGPQPLDPVPAARSLKVGRYEIPGPEFAFRGTIGKVRVIRDEVRRP